MELIVYWTDFAKGELKRIFEYYKVIYFINSEKNQVEITDVFDTRQNPIKMSRSI